jgi:hypothetical protein
LKKGDAYIVCCKNHINDSKKCRHNSVNCALHCSRNTLIAKNSLKFQGFQALVFFKYYRIMKNSNHHKKNRKNMIKKLTPDLFCTMGSCSNLSTIMEMVCVFFTVCLQSLQNSIHKKNLLYLVSGCHTST